MKITAVKGIPLGCTCSPISDALSTSAARQALLVRIETDSGYYGIGEAFTYGAPLAVMKYIVEMQLAPILMDLTRFRLKSIGTPCTGAPLPMAAEAW